jgi:2-C-methyl-D-erythritol 4-phosphate cytidylyltransferase
MDRKRYIIIMAGGSGTRMGSATPKQFLMLRGRAVLHHTMQQFIDAEPGIKIITVLPKEHIEYWKQYCIANNLFYPQTIVQGGITRLHSVRNGLEKVPEGALVGVHDGVRPLVSKELINTLYKKAEIFKAVIPITPCTDTMKAVSMTHTESGEEKYETIPDMVLDRSIMFGAQTPQVFHSEVLKAAYRQAFDTAFTDDASVVAKNGGTISYTKGERLNLKITTPEDMLIANAILSE